MSKRGFEETLAQHGLYRKLTSEEMEEQERVRLKERYKRTRVLNLIKDDEEDEG